VTFAAFGDDDERAWHEHSSLGMLSPIDYEQHHQQEAIAA